MSASWRTWFEVLIPTLAVKSPALMTASAFGSLNGSKVLLTIRADLIGLYTAGTTIANDLA